MTILSGSGKAPWAWSTEGSLVATCGALRLHLDILQLLTDWRGYWCASQVPTSHSRLCSVPAAQSLPSGQNSI